MTEDPFLFLPNMLCLVQQSEWLLHRAGPLTRRPSLRPNINCQSPVNRNCFYNLAVHLLECRGPQSSPASHRQECKSRDKARLREKDKEAEIERKTLWSVCQKNLAYLCLYSSPLLKSPTSSSATFSSSVHLCRGKKKQQENESSETNGFHICSILSGLFYLISLCQECRCELTTWGGKAAYELKSI